MSLWSRGIGGVLGRGGGGMWACEGGMGVLSLVGLVLVLSRCGVVSLRGFRVGTTSLFGSKSF